MGSSAWKRQATPLATQTSTSKCLDYVGRFCSVQLSIPFHVTVCPDTVHQCFLASLGTIVLCVRQSNKHLTDTLLQKHQSSEAVLSGRSACIGYCKYPVQYSSMAGHLYNHVCLYIPDSDKRYVCNEQ